MLKNTIILAGLGFLELNLLGNGVDNLIIQVMPSKDYPKPIAIRLQEVVDGQLVGKVFSVNLHEKLIWNHPTGIYLAGKGELPQWQPGTKARVELEILRHGKFVWSDVATYTVRRMPK